MLSILYVDDEQLNLDLMALTFKRDFMVHKALSGDEALKKLAELDISVLLTDYKMAGMNGVQLIQKAKELYPNLRCMLLTGFDEMALKIDEESRTMISQVIQKPFKKSELKDIIQPTNTQV